jgi:hypothetical protein
MRARCKPRLAWLLRCVGAAGVITVYVSVLALTGSPQVHERIARPHTRLIHSCVIAVSKADKRSRAIENCVWLLVPGTPVAIVRAPWTILTLVWVPKLFLKACRCEHGPPVFC